MKMIKREPIAKGGSLIICFFLTIILSFLKIYLLFIFNPLAMYIFSERERVGGLQTPHLLSYNNLFVLISI